MTARRRPRKRDDVTQKFTNNLCGTDVFRETYVTSDMHSSLQSRGRHRSPPR